MTLSNITPDWLKTQLADPEQEKPVLTILGSEVMTQRECEKKLLALIGHSKFQLARILLKNRFTIYFGTLFTQATTDLEKEAVLKLMEKHKSEAGKELLAELVGTEPEKKIDSTENMTASRVLEEKM